MVGFNEETEMLIEQLVRGHRQLDVISIFGMPGLGKTTLAKKLYDHETISNRFDIRLWCCSSQSYNNRALLFELLGHICELDDITKEKSDDELAEKLYRYLKGKRYLIVVDDVWSPNAWDDIKRPFPDDNKGSRIILTTRLESITTYAMINSSPHHLRLFTEEESWMLLKEKVFKEDNCYCPQQLEDIGKQIATKCGGLPLAIVLVAGVLAKNDKEIVHWQQVRERLKLKMQGCMDIVESSYQHLPVHLQNCFLYFASFLEGKKVPVQKLIRLWIAENFVEASSTTLKSLEMVAMDYLMDLIRSNLVMVANINSSGELKAVYIHDVIHEFSLRKAKVGNFLLRINDQLRSRVRAVETASCRNTAVYILPSSKGRSGRIYILAPSGRNINTLRFLPSVNSPWVDLDLAKSWKNLRVLDLSSVKLHKTHADALRYLIHLKYLELQLPSDYTSYTICNLKELETFIATGVYHKSCIPNSIWGMTSLRHLHISTLYTSQILEDLDNLKTCSNLVIDAGVYYQSFMKRLPNLEKLSCRLCGSGTRFYKYFPAFGSLGQLKSLKIDVTRLLTYPYGFEDFTYPSSLKKLTLAYLELPWSKMSYIGSLSNLEFLKLEGNGFKGRWDVKDGEFSNLKVLKLKKLGLSEWTASDDSYPNLQRVLVHGCWKLEEIPYSFGSSCSMQLIEVRSCCDSAVNAALKIKETQIEEMGNSEFKVIICK
ncbi:putative late blight resistance protein homolog R1B-16 isoform X1 [Nicotiana sylvestris]|uniref:Late blight resistance protein homolog R1B-16 isoform X1 n=1 Tax=Nicotiana sylvestris TaxID=4096 RepID=A0A1U7XKV2_NICSY|nr:PREDICTED: putative late blight resistance protein homolog R1B-16 isoform X1 [Nicotiana sylvestris]